jgi:Asp-tRNA(Asn)/Glu-tRNA(Gln) amidotransferase A subunit family amidase
MSFSKDVVGPITRTVIDAAMMLEAISGKDPGDPESAHNPVPEYSELLGEGIKGKRFGVPTKHFFDFVHEDTRKVFDDALGVIRNMGGIVNDVEVGHIDLAPNSFNVSLSECVFLLEEYLRAFDPEATIDKYLDQLGADVKGLLGSQKGMADSKPVPGYDYVKTVRKHRNKMIAGFEEALFNRDALLIPTTPLPATRIEDDVETELLGKRVNTFRTFTRNCNPISMVGYPAITIPAGYSASGLPIGLQIVTRPWEEDKLLSMAHAFEQTTKVRMRPELAAF